MGRESSTDKGNRQFEWGGVKGGKIDCFYAVQLRGGVQFETIIPCIKVYLCLFRPEVWGGGLGYRIVAPKDAYGPPSKFMLGV